MQFWNDGQKFSDFEMVGKSGHCISKEPIMEEKSFLDSEFQSNFIVTDHGEDDYDEIDEIEDSAYLNF